MAQKKISELTAAGALTGAELVPIVQSGATVRTTTQDIADLGGGGGGSDWGDIGGTLSNQTDLQAALDAKEALYRTFDRKIADYPLVLSDSTKGIEMNVAGANTVTVPLNATQAFPVGTLIPVVQYGAGLTSIVATGGVTINTSAGNLDSPGQNAPMFLRKIATNEWYLWNGTAGGGGAVDSVNGQTGVVVLDAGDIANTPAGGIAATDVQAAINELDTEKQPIDSDLTAIAGLTPSNDDFLQRKAGAWANRTVAQVKTDLGIVAASESASGIAEIATQTETNTGTDDLRIVTPLKALVKNRKESTKTTGYTVAQTDDQGLLIANSASAIAFDFPSLEAGTYVTIININAGDVTWTNSGGTSFVGGLTSMPGGTLMAVTFRYRSTTVIEILGGAPASVENFAVTGSMSVKAGASTGTTAKVGGAIHCDTTQTGNVGTGVDTLFTVSLPANTLNTNKDRIRGFVCGTFAANANNKQVIVKFGATNLFATGAVAFNTGDWRIDFDVVRTSATTQKASARWTSDNTTLDESHDYTTPAETLSGAITILVTGEATSNNDIVGEMFAIEFVPTP